MTCNSIPVSVVLVEIGWVHTDKAQMAKKRRKTWWQRYVLIGLIVAIAIWGVYRGATWSRERSIEERIDCYNSAILRSAREQSLSPALVRAVIRCESAGDEHARSRIGARGLMQITAITQKELLRLGKIRQAGDLEDADFNIRLGTMYLRLMLDKFDQDKALAVAAYNAGPTRMADLRAAHPELPSQELVDRFAPAETKEYSRNVLQWQQTYQEKGFGVWATRRELE